MLLSIATFFKHIVHSVENSMTAKMNICILCMQMSVNTRHKKGRTALRTLPDVHFSLSSKYHLHGEEAYLWPFFSAPLHTYEEHALEEARGKAKDPSAIS